MVIIYEVWKSQNRCIFENIKPSSSLVSIKVLQSLNIVAASKSTLKHRIITFLDNFEDISTRFFGKAAKNEFYGAGMILNIRKEHHIHLRMVVGE